MSETIVRSLDKTTVLDSSGDKYFVVFCSRDSDNVTTLPGHAFVVWGKESSASATSQIDAEFGFYPAEGANPLNVAFGHDVPGDLKNEAMQPASYTSGLLTSRLIVQVDNGPYNASKGEMTTWSTSDYNLYKQNCISFAAAIASDLGLTVPTTSVLLPETFIKSLVTNNGA